MPAPEARRARGSTLRAEAPDTRPDSAGEAHLDAMPIEAEPLFQASLVTKIVDRVSFSSSFSRGASVATLARAWWLIVVAKRMIGPLLAEAVVIAKRMIGSLFTEAIVIVVAEPVVWTALAETTHDDQFEAKPMI